MGFEPTSSSLQRKRSASWATTPNKTKLHLPSELTWSTNYSMVCSPLPDVWPHRAGSPTWQLGAFVLSVKVAILWEPSSLSTVLIRPMLDLFCFCFPPEIRTPIQWLKTTCPAIRREENIVAISRLELPTGSYPNLAHETSAAPALQYSCGGGNRTHLVQAYETCVCTSSSSPQFIFKLYHIRHSTPSSEELYLT